MGLPCPSGLGKLSSQHSAYQSFTFESHSDIALLADGKVVYLIINAQCDLFSSKCMNI